MSPSAPPDLRFKDRAEILDFLLEVSTATQETLDLHRILANVASIVTRVIPSQLFAILLYSERRKGLRIRYALGTARKSSKTSSSPSAKASPDSPAKPAKPSSRTTSAATPTTSPPSTPSAANSPPP